MAVLKKDCLPARGSHVHRDMPHGSPHSQNQVAQVEEVCRRVFRHLLMRDESCRQHIAAHVSLSPASATNYTRWLSGRGYLASRSVKAETSKRPVEWIRLAPEKAAAVIVAISSAAVYAELVAADGKRVWQVERPVEEKRQTEVMQAINCVVEACCDRAREEGHCCGFTGISVSGTVGYGIIFSLDGVDDWRPCTPTELLPAFEEISAAEVWTRIQCKLTGFAHSRACQNSLGYFEWDGGLLRMASMKEGTVIDGRNGTVSARLHQPVGRQGSLCYCGRRGCFIGLLEHGEARREDVHGVIEKLTREDDMTAAAVEWRGEGDPLKASDERGTELVAVDAPVEFALKGLRLLAAEEALVQAVRADRADASAGGGGAGLAVATGRSSRGS